LSLLKVLFVASLIRKREYYPEFLGKTNIVDKETIAKYNSFKENRLKELSAMESFGRYCAAIYRLSQSIFNHKLKELKISSGQYDFFLVIAKNEGINQKELGDRLYVEKSTTAKAVKQLETKGYVYKNQVEKDKRYSALYLTETGRKASAAVESVFSEMLGIFSKDISDSKVEETVRVLKKVIQNLHEEKRKYIGD